jgi:uncharacterized protein YbaR (Trm112 family)
MAGTGIVAQPQAPREEPRAAEKLRYMSHMALNRELIDILACPKCKGALELRTDESAFECSACRLAYLVNDDIPNFLIEEAQPLG